MNVKSENIFTTGIFCLYLCISMPAAAESQEVAADKNDVSTVTTAVIGEQVEPGYEPTDSPAETLTPEPADTSVETITPAASHLEPPPAPPVIDKPLEPNYAPQQETGDSSNIEDDTSVTVITKEEFESWTDTRPNNVNADWLQLISGEWLRGRIIIMQKENLEFDSDELDDLEIEWKKVRYIKSYEPYSLRFDGRIQAVGTIEITQHEVHVASDYDDLTFKRSELQSIASGKETEISKWTNKITFSINMRRGNTNQFDFTSKVSAKRRTINSRLLFDYLGNFTEVENTETINNHRINVTYDLFVTRNFFVTPLTAELFRDPFQNIERRRNIGIAIGYTLINTNESEWDISGGPAFQETQFVSVQPGEPTSDSTGTLILGTKFDTELNDKVDLEGTYSVTLGDQATGGYAHHALLTVETELTDKLDFDVTMVWDRIQQPVQAADGNFPEADDFRILIGLGYDL